MARKTNGTTICELRKALGIQQLVLAGRVGIATPYLSQIENGQRQPSPEVARKIATELGVPLDAITYPVAEPEPAATS